MIEIIPGILEKEWGAIEKKIELVRPFAKTIHIDLLDGKFAENSTFLDPAPFEKYTKDIDFELHMMVEEPIEYLQPFAKVGFKRFLGHIEKMSDQVAFVAKAQELGEAGLAIDGPTSLEDLEVPLQDLDTVLFMTIKAGFSGQTFMTEYALKIQNLSNPSQIPIEVDGGINRETIIQARNAGASRSVATSFLFGTGDSVQEQYELLHFEATR